jgi:DNA-binding MarR family transcriptional regulator
VPVDLETLMGGLLVTAHRLTRIAAQTTGTTTPAAVWHTLSILTTDGPLRVGDLARSARVTQPSMTKLLRQMVEDGLVQRTADTEDSRAWLIEITPKGKAALERWRTQLGTALGVAFADLSDADARILQRAVIILRERTNNDKNRKVAP